MASQSGGLFTLLCARSRWPHRASRADHAQKAADHIDQMLTLAVLALLLVGCFLVLQPFLTAVVWAAILCATSWPLFARLRVRFRRHDWLALV